MCTKLDIFNWKKSSQLTPWAAWATNISCASVLITMKKSGFTYFDSHENIVFCIACLNFHVSPNFCIAYVLFVCGSHKPLPHHPQSLNISSSDIPCNACRRHQTFPEHFCSHQTSDCCLYFCSILYSKKKKILATV